MWLALVFATFAVSAHPINYRLLPRKSHTHKLTLGSSTHWSLAAPAQEVLLTGPGMLRVEAKRKDTRSVRVYVREPGAIDEVVSLVEANEGEVLVALPAGPHTVDIVADGDAVGTVAVTFATSLSPKAVPTPQTEVAQIPQPEARQQNHDVTPRGPHPMAALDSGEAVFVVKPGRPLRLLLSARVTGVHLLIWRALIRPETRLIVRGDNHLLMSAVLAASEPTEHLNGDTVVATPEDLFVEPDPGTRQLLLTTDDTIGVAIAK